VHSIPKIRSIGSLIIFIIIYYIDFKPEHAVERIIHDGKVRMKLDVMDPWKYISDNDTIKEKQLCGNAWFFRFPQCIFLLMENGRRQSKSKIKPMQYGSWIGMQGVHGLTDTEFRYLQSPNFLLKN
jgi:hypothetical protein